MKRIHSLWVYFTFLVPVLTYAQSSYEIACLGAYSEPVVLDSSKNWYLLSAGRTDSAGYSIRYQAIKLNIKTDLYQYKEGNLFYTTLHNSTSHLRGSILIGTTDTIPPYFSEEADRSVYNLAIGSSYQVREQNFLRTSSPYINLRITGNIRLKDFTPDVTKYNLDVVCDYTHDYYIDYYNTQTKPGKLPESFIQHLNPLIQDWFRQEELVKNTHIRYSYLAYTGYIDRDHLKDFVIYINGRYFLFLSHKHDFRRKTILTLEDVWSREDMEF